MAPSSVDPAGFEFASGGITLRGIAVMPASARTALIMIHGWGTCRTGPQRHFVDLAGRLAGRGVASLRFDLPGRGISDGDDASVTINIMARAAADAVTCLRAAHPGLERIGLAGICSGGNAAILAALIVPVDFLVLWSTFSFRVRKGAADRTRRTGRMLGVYARKLFAAATWGKLFRGALHPRLIRDALFGPRAAAGRHPKDSAVDAMAAWRGSRGPVLFVYGTADPGAPEARAAFEAHAREAGLDARFVDIPGASHNFYRAEWAAALLDATAAFIAAAGPAEG
ncbi:MAG: alpha/beta fold hydrolase [Planctomycetota bacterium]